MRPLFLTLVFVLVVSPLGSPSVWAISCVEFLERLSEDFTDGHVSTPNAKLDVGLAYAQRSQEQASFEGFQAFLRERFAMLSPEERQRAEIMLHSTLLFHGDSPSGMVPGYGAFFLPFPGAIVISLPNSLHRTEIANFAQAHELEHAIQLFRSNTLAVPDYAIHDSLDVDTIRARERGAMLAEWAYLQILPDQRVNELIEILEAEEGLPHGLKESLLTGLRGKNLSAESYLREMELLGRYDEKNVVEDVIPDNVDRMIGSLEAKLARDRAAQDSSAQQNSLEPTIREDLGLWAWVAGIGGSILALNYSCSENSEFTKKHTDSNVVKALQSLRRLCESMFPIPY